MKKLIVLLFFIGICATGNSQGLFKPVPKDLFSSGKIALEVGEKPSAWILRLNTGVIGTSYGRNKETKEMEMIPLDAIGFGIAYLHYKDADGIPFNDFGFNALLLQNTQIPGMGLGIYGTYNTGAIGLLNLGTHYDFPTKRFLLDTGLTFHF